MSHARKWWVGRGSSVCKGQGWEVESYWFKVPKLGKLVHETWRCAVAG